MCWWDQAVRRQGSQMGSAELQANIHMHIKGTSSPFQNLHTEIKGWEYFYSFNNLNRSIFVTPHINYGKCCVPLVLKIGKIWLPSRKNQLQSRVSHWESGNNSNFPQLRLIRLTLRFNMAAPPPAICGGNVLILQDTHITVHLKLMLHVVTATTNWTV